MTTAIVESKNPQIAEQILKLDAMKTEELRKLLTKDMGDVAGRLVRMASIVAVLESRGEDLSELKLGMIDHLRKIASGQLLPEIVVRFNGRPAILAVASNLPLPDQKKLASGDGIPVVVPRDGGGYDTRMIDPAYLRAEQIRQVFDRDRIRTETEQIAILDNVKVRPRTVKATVKRGKVKIDRERVGIVLGRTFFPLADLLSALGELKREGDDDGDRNQVATVTLTEDELGKLDRIVADRTGTRSRTVVIRDALLTLGLI